MEKECLFCGNLFTKPYNESINAWKNRHKYCSRKCADNDKIGKHYSPNTEFKKGQIAINKGKSAWWSKGELNCKWKGGVNKENEKIRHSLEYKEWRMNVWKRDRFTCQECGSVGVKLHAHHIQSFSQFPELRLSLENGITLCEDCHRKKHPNMNFVHIELQDLTILA
jgi:hypothetical protein